MAPDTTTAPPPSKAVIIYGPQGCGKTCRAIELATFYGKTRIIDDWQPGMPLPSDALVLTSVEGVEGAIYFTAHPTDIGTAAPGAPALRVCSGDGIGNTYCGNPKHTATHQGATYMDWVCTSCSGTGSTWE